MHENRINKYIWADCSSCSTPICKLARGVQLQLDDNYMHLAHQVTCSCLTAYKLNTSVHVEMVAGF